MKASLPVSTTLMRIVGYGLLLLSLLDMMAMLLPFRLTDAGWRFQIFGELIERIVVPLLAVMLIFYGESQDRKKQEKLFLPALSWLCLGFGVILFLLIPISLFTAQRMDVQFESQMKAQYNQAIQQLEQSEQKLKVAKPDQLKQFMNQRGFSIPENSDSLQVQDKLAQFMFQERRSLTSQYQQARSDQQMKLLKNGIKWSLGALVSGTLFIYIWRLTLKA